MAAILRRLRDAIGEAGPGHEEWARQWLDYLDAGADQESRRPPTAAWKPGVAAAERRRAA